MNTNDTQPFGFWITAVDRLMKDEFATVFADEGISRRDWRMLNVIDGTVPGRKGRPERADFRPLHGRKLHRLIELGWIERTDDGWSLTEAGRLAKTRLSAAVDELRDRVAGVVSHDEYAAMTASLEKIAREFGWEEGKPLPRRRGRGHGHGRGHGRGFDESGHRGGHRHGHGFRGHPGFAPATHVHIHTH